VLAAARVALGGPPVVAARGPVLPPIDAKTTKHAGRARALWATFELLEGWAGEPPPDAASRPLAPDGRARPGWRRGR